MIAIITLIGVTKGLKRLEVLEKWALATTLVIIAVLFVSFANYDLQQWQAGTLSPPEPLEHTSWEVLTTLAGTLIVVQGFETSRYLGDVYPAELRIKTSLWSQLTATGVYLVFVSLAVPISVALNGQYNDHSLIDIAQTVSVLLVLPLVLAASLSQFSAAVADTLAAGGNIEEVTQHKLSIKKVYWLIGLSAIVLTWSADTYQILALASRAFAFYYLLQCLVALSLAKTNLQKISFSLLALILAFITAFAVPAG